MKQMNFVQLQQNNTDLFEKAKSLWLPFISEVNMNDGAAESDEEILSGLKKRIAIQGKRSDMHFEIALVDEIAMGIAMFAIDHGTIYGLLDHPGYGTIMGFYIKPEYRRMGYGRKFFEHIRTSLQLDGANELYLCPDSVTGVPFWKAMGFADSGKTDPDDKKPIYTSDLGKPRCNNEKKNPSC